MFIFIPAYSNQRPLTSITALIRRSLSAGPLTDLYGAIVAAYVIERETVQYKFITML